MGHIEKKRRIWVRILCAILLFVLLFTIISRVTASFTVAQIRVEGTSARKIQHGVTAEGTIMKNRETAVVTQPDILVKEIMVRNGDVVDEDTVLIKLDTQSLDDKITQINDEIQTLTLQNQDLQRQTTKAARDQKESAERASEDYKQAVKKNRQAVKDAKADLQAAKDELKREKERIDDSRKKAADTTELDRATEDYNIAVTKNQTAVANAAAALQEAKNELAKAIDASTQAKCNETVKERQADYDAALSMQESELRTARRALEDAKKAASNTDKAAKEKDEETIKTLEAAVLEKKQACDTAVSTEKSEIQTAKRAMEDAAGDVSPDNTGKVNQISLEQLQVKLDKLKKLQSVKGEIKANNSGTITAVNTNVGDKTPETAVVTMTKDEEGYIFEAVVTKDDIKYLAIGDSITLTSAAQKLEDVEVAGIEAASDDSGGSEDGIKVWAEIPADTFQIGDSVTMSSLRDSEEYECTVPLTALIQENSKTFIHVVEKEQTVLGEACIARKTEVKLIDKNSSYAAIDGSSLEEDCQIIVETDRYVEAGARVRLVEE